MLTRIMMMVRMMLMMMMVMMVMMKAVINIIGARVQDFDSQLPADDISHYVHCTLPSPLPSPSSSSS